MIRKTTSLDLLGGLSSGTPVLVRGRLLLCRGREGVLYWEGAQARCEVDEALPPAGALVTLDGVWSDGRILAARAVVSGHVPERFPMPGGDFPWFGEAGGRRLALLRQRARILHLIRSFFDDAGFLEVETPTMVPCPGLDLHLGAFEVVPAVSPRFLATSPEYQMKRLLSAGITPIYQIGRCFRLEEQGSRHQPEFTMLEFYRGFATADQVMKDTEELVAEVAARLLGATTVTFAGATVDLSTPWPRLTVAEALRRHAGASFPADGIDEDRFFRCWVEQVEPALGCGRPTFVTEWPASMASLARLLPDSGLADRFEAYVAGMELCNGFGELVDPTEQERRLHRDQQARAEAGLPVYPVDRRFLAALEEGLPACAGNALGVDRLVMLLLGCPEIADVVAFPAERL